MKKIIVIFRDQFFKELDKRPSWGKEQIKELFIITLNNVLLGNYEQDKSD